MSAVAERCGKAAQDAQIIFGPSRDAGGGWSVTETLHAPGPATRAEKDAANVAAQLAANDLADAGKFEEARALLIAVAEAQTAMFPQYRGKWDDAALGFMTRRWHGKGGTRAEMGDAVLITRRGLDRDYDLTLRAARTDACFAAEDNYVTEVYGTAD